MGLFINLLGKGLTQEINGDEGFIWWVPASCQQTLFGYPKKPVGGETCNQANTMMYLFLTSLILSLWDSIEKARGEW